MEVMLEEKEWIKEEIIDEKDELKIEKVEGFIKKIL
jgi:hypothetical protein